MWNVSPGDVRQGESKVAALTARARTSRHHSDDFADSSVKRAAVRSLVQSAR